MINHNKKKDEIKVAQLGGYVSEKMEYHHGEMSLFGAITSMAQDFIGVTDGMVADTAYQVDVTGHETGYDLLISVAVPYPIHWGIARIRTKGNKMGKIWVADCGDPYYGCKTDSFKKMFYFKYIEKWFCRKTDYISVPKSNGYQSLHTGLTNIIPNLDF